MTTSFWLLLTAADDSDGRDKFLRFGDVAVRIAITAPQSPLCGRTSCGDSFASPAFNVAPASDVAYLISESFQTPAQFILTLSRSCLKIKIIYRSKFKVICGNNYVVTVVGVTIVYNTQCRRNLERENNNKRHCLHFLLPKQKHIRILNSLRSRRHNHALSYIGFTLFKNSFLIDVCYLTFECFQFHVVLRCALFFVVTIFIVSCCMRLYLMRSFDVHLIKSNLLTYNSETRERSSR